MQAAMELRKKSAELDEIKDSNQTLQEECSKYQRLLGDRDVELLQLSTQLASAEADRDARQIELNELQQRITELTTLVATNATKAEAESNAARTGLEAELAALREQLATANNARERVLSELHAVRLSEGSLHEALKSASADTAALNESAEALQGELNEARLARDALEVEVCGIRASVVELEKKVEGAETRAMEAEAREEEREEALVALREAYTRLRKVEMDGLEEMDRRVSAVPTTPVSMRKRRRVEEAL